MTASLVSDVRRGGEEGEVTYAYIGCTITTHGDTVYAGPRAVDVGCYRITTINALTLPLTHPRVA